MTPHSDTLKFGDYGAKDYWKNKINSWTGSGFLKEDNHISEKVNC
ncbi:MAG: hypothetical protein NZ896_06255 [Nitrososphaerales archaeon]|nr:hypothetical protein [Nitrososphaerales archaeon]